MHDNMNYFNYKKGFTLIETLVALSIFSVSIVGIIVVSGQGLNDVNFVKTRFVASYFAQEALESARNMRDTNMLTLQQQGVADADQIWATFKSNTASCFSDTGCSLNTFSNDYTDTIACQTDYGCGFRYREEGIFGYVDGEPGIYRKLFFTEVSPNELLVTATAYWNQGSVQKQVSVSTYLFKWN